MSVYDKIQYGDSTTAKSTKLCKNWQKLTEKSQNQLKNHFILYYISGSTFQITHIRTATVQPPILCKNILIFIYQWEYTGMKIEFCKNIFAFGNIEIILIIINGCMSDL